MKILTIAFCLFLFPLKSLSQNIETKGQLTADSIDVNLGLIKNVANPIAPQDAATKAYVDEIKALFNEDLLNAGLNGIVEDVEGNIYKTIKIGSQVWMAENLRTTKFNNGTPIKGVQGPAGYSFVPPDYWLYENTNPPNYAERYGALYNFYTISVVYFYNNLRICPVGWHVPSDSEWTLLTDYLEDSGYGFEGSGPDVGKSMASTNSWKSSTEIGQVGNDQGTNNSSGFSGLPAGLRNSDGTFYGIGSSGHWWSSSSGSFGSPTTRNTAFMRILDYYSIAPSYGWSPQGLGLSIRCLRD